jgi:hypothetical protein
MAPGASRQPGRAVASLLAGAAGHPGRPHPRPGAGQGARAAWAARAGARHELFTRRRIDAPGICDDDVLWPGNARGVAGSFTVPFARPGGHQRRRRSVPGGWKEHAMRGSWHQALTRTRTLRPGWRRLAATAAAALLAGTGVVSLAAPAHAVAAGTTEYIVNYSSDSVSTVDASAGAVTPPSASTPSRTGLRSARPAAAPTSPTPAAARCR